MSVDKKSTVVAEEMFPVVKRIRSDVSQTPTNSRRPVSESSGILTTEKACDRGVKDWLLSSTPKSSEAKSSAEEAPKSLSVSGKVISKSQRAHAEGDTAEPEGQLACDGSGNSSNYDEFDSNGSWFLETVNDYCEKQVEGENDAREEVEKGVPGVDTFDSTTSSLMISFNAFGASRLKIVDYEVSSRSCENLRDVPKIEDNLSKETTGNDGQKGLGVVVDAIVVPETKFEVNKFKFYRTRLN